MKKKYSILHTESSLGWGGQEMRVLKEATGMRARGHRIALAVAEGGQLVTRGKDAGFPVYELSFHKASALWTVVKLRSILVAEGFDLLNSHSSMDAWIGGMAARLCGKKVIRTRHLSTPIRPGINSVLLYHRLADFVVTTCSSIIPILCAQARIRSSHCRCIPTGVDCTQIPSINGRNEIRGKYGIGAEDVVVGTACVLRSWKGIGDFLRAASYLREEKKIKWLIVGGGGYLENYRATAKELGLENRVIFTGHLDAPLGVMGAMDIFLLLSTAHEGISQATLQAGLLRLPLITTTVGGLPEVCRDGITGLIVPPHAPYRVAEAVKKLVQLPELKRAMGENAHRIVQDQFTEERMLNEMESVYDLLTK